MKLPNKISVIICFLVFSSCYESLDLNQLDNYVHKPVITSALTYFKMAPKQFFDANGVQQNTRTDITDFKAFDNAFVRNNLVKTQFKAEIKNELDRDVTIQVEFLDQNDNTIYTFTPILVQEKDLNFTYIEEIDIASNQNVLNTLKVKITAALENTGTQLNPNETSEFEFKSSVVLFFESN